VKRRFLQFDLRGLLAAVTVLVLALGWKAEQAHRRGRAIQAIVREYGQVWADQATGETPSFFQNVWRVPVTIQLEYVTQELIAQVVAAKPVSHLDIFGGNPDIKALERLNELNDGCEVDIDDCASAENGEAIVRLLPKADVRWHVCPTR
jgi:hypothetical protein